MPDFATVDQTIERRLREMGLQPRRANGVVETGLDGLTLKPGEADVATATDMPFFADVEINAALRHPVLGEHTISDRVTMDAATPDEVLALCATTYMDVTFPAIHALFDEEGHGGPEMVFVRVNRARESVRWKAYTGQLQILQDVTGEVAEYFRGNSVINLAQTALVSVLDGPTRLHWCKLYGARTARGLDFGCSIDGRKSGAAEAEMRRRCPPDLGGAGRWEFRLFITLLAAGEADESEVAAMRSEVAARQSQNTAQSEGQTRNQPPPKTSWWPFGRRG